MLKIIKADKLVDFATNAEPPKTTIVKETTKDPDVNEIQSYFKISKI